MKDVADAGERAAGFVAAQGDDLARARAQALLRRAPVDAVLERLPWSAAPIAVARRTLGICDDLRALQGSRIDALVADLGCAQAPDGGWAAGRPLAERLFESGMIAGHLAKTRSARPELLFAAAAFLAGHWSPDRVRTGSWEAIAAYAHPFANLDHEIADAVLQWCGRELGRGFATGAFGAVRTARVLVFCDAHGLPGARLGPAELLDAIAAEQEGDGGFPAADAEASPVGRVEATLDALVALRRLCGAD